MKTKVYRNRKFQSNWAEINIEEVLSGGAQVSYYIDGRKRTVNKKFKVDSYEKGLEAAYAYITKLNAAESAWTSVIDTHYVENAAGRTVKIYEKQLA